MFAISYATTSVHLSKVAVLLAVTGGALLMAALVPVVGWLADQYGRRTVFGAGVALFGVTVLPSFAALHSGSTVLMFAELFDARVRYTGMSLVFQGSGIWASGLTPVILTGLLALTGGQPWAAAYLSTVALISLLAVLAMRRYLPRPQGQGGDG